MNSVSQYEAMNLFVRDKLRNVHTIKPAVVTKNNGHTVNVRPLTTTRYRDGTHLPFPEIPDVPLMIYSGTKGAARVTVPIVAGDTVMLLCSDRDYGDLLDSEVDVKSFFLSDEIEPLELFPIMAIPSFFTEPEGKPVDTENIVIENDSTKITVKPNGDIDIDTPTNINVTAGGDANLTVGGDASLDVTGGVTATVGQDLSATIAGAVTMASIGAVMLSGPSVTIDSPMTTFTGGITVGGLAVVTGALSAATITSATVSLDTHVHPYSWTDPSGSGSTGTPT